MVDLSQLPASRHFADRVTLKAPVVALDVILLTLATVFVGLRLYTRKFLLRMLGWEDCKVHPNGFAWVIYITDVF